MLNNNSTCTYPYSAFLSHLPKKNKLRVHLMPKLFQVSSALISECVRQCKSSLIGDRVLFLECGFEASHTNKLQDCEGSTLPHARFVWFLSYPGPSSKIQAVHDLRSCQRYGCR